MRKWLLLTCRQLTLVSTDYLEGCLPLSLRLQAAFHLSWCRPCQAFMAQLRQTIVVLGQLPPGAPPETMRAQLIRQFEHVHAAR